MSQAHIIPATIIRIKHTTKITDMMIFVSADIIVGKAFVGLVVSAFDSIQSQMIGKHVFNLIQSQGSQHFLDVVVVAGSVVIGGISKSVVRDLSILGDCQAWAETTHHNHQNPNNTAKNHHNK